LAIHWLVVDGSLRAQVQYDVILRGGTLYDGSGSAPVQGDVALQGDRIVAVGDLTEARGQQEIDVRGLAVAPGFVNMLSWATESLIQDGRSPSDICQGVTLEVMGEGNSMGPLNEAMKTEMYHRQGDIRYSVEWTTLGEYLDYLVKHGVSCNVASFVGAATVRTHEIGEFDRPPTASELSRMQDLVRHAMREGAMGVASALIYAPGTYAQTDELVALASAAGEYDGMYISHLRSEANQLLPAIDELIHIARKAGVPAEIYHLKAAGRANWNKLAAVIKRIESARAEGLQITADMYLYTAGATGLDAAMPPWVQEGGFDAWAERLKDPETRRRVAREMTIPSEKWESLYLAAGSADNVLLVGFKNERLKPLTGKTLAEIARLRDKSPEETAIELVVEDGSRVDTVYFLMSEENVRRQVMLPWVSFNSDAASLAPEEPFIKSNPHPRAYGNFARLLGKYVRDEKLIPLEEAIRRLTSFPAETLKLRQRGRLQAGYYADIAVFDPMTIRDRATYDQPHQYATGMVHVFVNGQQVLKDGNHTGAKPGRVVRGPGWTGWKE
jgi:N-acyl-D-amino-acid deacylase